MTRIQQAAYSAMRVFFYAAIGSFLATVAPIGSDAVPDVRTLQDALVAAGYAGLIALLSFVWNLLSPRVPIER